MSVDPAVELLALLPQWGFAVLLVFARIGSAMMLLPGVGEAETPPMIRLGFAMLVTALMLPGLVSAIPAQPDSPLMLAAMLTREIAIGLWFGWLVRLLLVAFGMAGQMIAGAVGMTNVVQPDLMLGAGSAALSRLLGLAAPLLLLVSGLWAAPIQALFGLYTLLPAGELLQAGDAAQSTIQAVGESLALALRLAGPFLVAGLVFHTGLALMGRLVPHLQLHFAAAPGQLLGGIALLGVLAPFLVETWLEAARSTLAALPGH